MTESEKKRMKARIRFLADNGHLASMHLPDGFRKLHGRFSNIYEIRLLTTHNPRLFYFIMPSGEIVLLDGVNKGGMRDREMDAYYQRADDYRIEHLGREARDV